MTSFALDLVNVYITTYVVNKIKHFFPHPDSKQGGGTAGFANSAVSSRSKPSAGATGIIGFLPCERLPIITPIFGHWADRVAVSEVCSDVLARLSGRPPVVTRCHLFATLRANTHGACRPGW
jgi:hypothetical protein